MADAERFASFSLYRSKTFHSGLKPGTSRKKKKLADQMKLWESAPLRAFWQPRSHDF
jgi:hypothetical protein